MKFKYIIHISKLLVSVFFTSQIVLAQNNVMGFVQGGVDANFKNNDEKKLNLSLQSYQFSTTSERVSFNAKFSTKIDAYEISKDPFDPYAFDNYLLSLNGFNLKGEKSWFAKLGVDSRSYSPISLSGSELRGVSAGTIIPVTTSEILGDIALSGFFGASKNDIAGYEVAITNVDGIVYPSAATYRQQNGGGILSLNFGDRFKFDHLVTYFFDDEKSLTNGANYLAIPQTTLLYSPKFGYYSDDAKLWVNYSLSSWDTDTKTNDENILGHAGYLQGEYRMGTFVQISGDLTWISPKFHNTSAGFESNKMSGNLTADFRLNTKIPLSLGFNTAVSRNNTLFENPEEYMSIPVLDQKVSATLALTKELSLSLNGGIGGDWSQKLIGGDKTSISRWSAGSRVRYKKTLGSTYEFIFLNVGGSYASKVDESVQNYVTNDTIQNVRQANIAASLELDKIGNGVSFSYYNIASDGKNITLYKGSEKFTYKILPSKLHTSLTYSLSKLNFYTGVDNLTQSLLASCSVYLFDAHEINFQAGIEKYNDNKTKSLSYQGLIFGLSYQYTL